MLSFYLTLIDGENDRKMFEKIYYVYRKQMYTVALTVLKNQDDAEDTVHDVFCNIAEKHIYILNKIKNDDDIRNYLLKATKNTAINLSKKKALNEKYKEDIVNSKIEKIYSDEEFWEQLCRESTYQTLVNAIRSLDERYSEVLYLHYILDLSVSDVSKTLGRNLQTVKKQIVRGKTLLIESLGNSEVF